MWKDSLDRPRREHADSSEKDLIGANKDAPLKSHQVATSQKAEVEIEEVKPEIVRESEISKDIASLRPVKEGLDQAQQNFASYPAHGQK